MTTWATQAELARILGMSRQNLGKLLKRRIIGGKAITGEGRGLRIDVDLARRQVRSRRDVGQAITNGAKTRLGPAASRPPPDEEDETTDAGTDLDEAIKREKLIEIQGRNRKAAEDEAARSGRYTDATATSAAMTRMAAAMLSVMDGVLSDLAADAAARHQSNGRDELHAMRKAFISARTRMAADAAKAAAAVPRLVPSSAPAAED